MARAIDPHLKEAPEAASVPAETTRFLREPEKGGRDLKPIGPERLRALREAIRNGTYPSDAHVESGLLRMIARPVPRRPEA